MTDPTTQKNATSPERVESVARLMEELSERALVDFQSNDRIRSFPEYLADLLADPARLTRNAAQYVVDMLEYYGRYEVKCIGQSCTRLSVFDAAYAEGRGRVQGQELAMQRLYQNVRYLAQKGRIDRFVLLHGPNGSAKSSMVEAIIRGLEHYSHMPEGSLYSFNWVFSERYEGARLGFENKEGGGEPKDSYATLDPEDISCLVSCELKDSPLFLIPREFRVAILRKATREARKDLDITEYVQDGELCQKCRGIYEGLMNAYQGNWERVVQHVQVERYFISKRYRRSAVVIDPQRNVDAASRPTFHERGAYVPPLLAHANLFEPFGDLVDANGGVVEYSDFLKRQPETNKYLLTTIEKGTMNLPNFMAYLNLVMFGTTNEFHLTAFKHSPDWPSFKGRIELVRVPYLLEYRKEEQIYASHLATVAKEKHVAPHAAVVAALWAVLTRLKRPESDHFPEPAGRLLARLSPLEKARLYDHTATPEWCSEEERRLVLGNLKALLEEFDDQEEEFEGVVEPAYEGRRGASPRETLTLLSEAASDPLHSCLSPLAILRTIKEFVKETSVFDFLRLPAQGAYHNQDSLLELVREEYYRIVLEEIRDAIGLVDEAQYLRLFQDYFVHVKAYARGEKVRNSSTKNLEDPSESVMQEVERVLQPKEPVEGFRKGLITRIAAYSLDHPEIPLDYKNVFPEIFRAIKEDFFHQREHALSTAHANFLKLGTPEFAGLDAERRREVENAMVRMRERHGYCEHCAKEVIAFVSRWENKEA